MVSYSQMMQFIILLVFIEICKTPNMHLIRQLRHMMTYEQKMTKIKKKNNDSYLLFL